MRCHSQREHGWVAVVSLGALVSAVELLRIGMRPERLVEWWAASWLLGLLGIPLLVALVVLTRQARFTALEGAATLLVANVPLFAALLVAALSTDWLAGASPARPLWLDIHGCMPPLVPVGGRLTGLEIAGGLAIAAAVGVLPTSSRWIAIVRAVVVCVPCCVAMVADRWEQQVAHTGLALAACVIVMSWGARTPRRATARVLAAFVLVLTVTWDALAKVAIIRGGGQMGPVDGHYPIIEAAQQLAQSEAPVALFAIGAALLLLACAPALLGHAGGDGPPLASSTTAWVALGMLSLPLACLAHYRAERSTFTATLDAALDHASTASIAHYASVPAAIKDPSLRAVRATVLVIVPALDSPTRTLRLGQRGRIRSASGSGDRLRVLASADNTAQSVVGAIFKSARGAEIFELVLDDESSQ